MAGFNWEFDFDPTFTMHVFPYTVVGNRDHMHWHQYFEIGLCLKGTGKFAYLDKLYDAEPGDIFLSNNFENHVAFAQGEDTTDYLFLIFMPSFIANPNGRALDLEYLSPFYYNPLAFCNKIAHDSEVAQVLKALFHQAYALYATKGQHYKLRLDVVLRQILITLAGHYDAPPDMLGGQQPMVNIKIQKAIKYLNLHYNENVTLEHMADRLSMNACYFRHLFKENMQVSFKAYITCLRISQARKLLIATDKSILDIVSEVGYTNTSQFYRMFEQYTNVTPAEYRRRYRSET